MRVLVTGASGFVGRYLCKHLSERGYQVRAAARTGASTQLVSEVIDRVEIPDYRVMSPEYDWGQALDGIDVVIHLAGLAHVMGPDRSRVLESYRQVNEVATRILVRAVVRAGVSRFVFVSTAKVFGEETRDRPFSENDAPNPQDEYARSKWAAEQSVIAATASTSCIAVIVRPPMVYGPDVRGNFPRLVRLIKSGIPLPLGAIDNRRTLVSVWNLCDLLERTAHLPARSGEIVLPMDDRSVSTPELLRLMAGAMALKVRLLNVPVRWLDILGRLSGRTEDVARLTGSLELDGTRTRQLLRWEPPLSIEEGLKRSVADGLA